MSVTDLSGFGPQADYAAKGDVFALTGVLGTDPVTGKLAEGAEAQFLQAFRNVAAIGEREGFSLDEIGRITVITPDAAYRPLINPGWLSLFPGDDNRPARKTTHALLDGAAVVELEVVGARGSRTPVEIEGVRHRDPLPMAARVGRHLYSSVVVTDVPNGNGARPERLAAIRQLFENMTAVVESAGGTLDDISNVWVFLGMWDLHERYVDVWVETFADEHSRPSRKTFYYPRTDIQLQLEAVLGGARQNLEIPGIGHHDPIPMGAVTGGVFTSSGIDARDPATGKAPEDVAGQAENCVANLGRLLEQAGLSPDCLYHVTGLVEHRSYIPMLTEAWRRHFPSAPDAAAFQTLELGLPGRTNYVQLLARGISG